MSAMLPGLHLESLGCSSDIGGGCYHQSVFFKCIIMQRSTSNDDRHEGQELEPDYFINDTLLTDAVTGHVQLLQRGNIQSLVFLSPEDMANSNCPPEVANIKESAKLLHCVKYRH
ncbi:hypothetical protein F2P81_001184 [Scophthalmus maximus]|uniref:Uncharacterized protein n=1 Tax=Scophthalmus maximus TaxID=52904 RepID=A0A6A4TYI2_SCOMX|nr:hypothetical protein F2P81_001184 [Scophthalmus maximus]